MLEPKRIIKNGIATIVFWNDATKTIVKCAEDDEPDDYMAFCAAYCKKVFGSNSQLKRAIKNARNAKPKKEDIHKVSNTKRLYLEMDECAQPKFPKHMPGCTVCKHANDCSISRSHYAEMCDAYNYGLDYKY